MAMHPYLPHLVKLQSVDARIAEVRAKLAEFPQQLAEVERRVEAARAALSRAREAYTQSLKDRKRYELDVEQWKEKVRKYKDQIYQVKSNEAYKALQHEIEMAESEVAKAEDHLLERMIAGEEFERQVKATERLLAEVEAAARADREKITAEQAVKETDLAALTAERDAMLVSIPEDLLDHYHRIARRHNGVALSEVRNETCTCCRVRVRPHVFQEVRNPANQDIFHCESCTRILYYVGEETAAPGQPEISGEASA